MKTCNNCKVQKELNFFSFDNYHNKYRSDCKSCVSARRARYKLQNPDKVKQTNKLYYQNNKDKIISKVLHYEKTTSNINYRLCRRLRDRFKKAIKNSYKKGSAVKDLGCTIEFFRNYIETLFQPEMSWDNYGKWHIDHIKPLASFDLTNPEEIKKACHYSNLQPLWAKDNLQKGSKYE